MTRLLGILGVLLAVAGIGVIATVRLDRDPPAPVPQRVAPAVPEIQSPGDGRRRVALVWIGGSDGRTLAALSEEGALPTWRSLRERGIDSALSREPGRAAAALDALRWPGRRADASPAGRLHGLGRELGTLAERANPLEPLSWVLPEREGLFERLRAEGRSAANLLESVEGDPVVAALRSLAAGDDDFVAVRIRTLETLPRDRGEAMLHEAHRAVDRSLDRLWRSLDGDDVLIVLAVPSRAAAADAGRLVAAGGGVPPGALPGRPSVRGVASAAAALLGVATDWPTTGLPRWAEGTGAPAGRRAYDARRTPKEERP